METSRLYSPLRYVSFPVLSLICSWVFVSHCFASSAKIPNPNTDQEKSELSFIGFYLYSPRPTNYSFSEPAYYGVPIQGRSVLLETKPGKEEITPYSLDHYNVLILQPNKEYSLHQLEWAEICGDRCILKRNLKVDPADSVLNFKGKPGEIVFLGVFQVTDKNTKNNKSSSQDPSIAFLEDGFKALANPKFRWDPEFKRKISDNKEEISFRSAEIRFLKTILQEQPDGYWKEKAENQLKLLTQEKN